VSTKGVDWDEVVYRGGWWKRSHSPSNRGS